MEITVTTKTKLEPDESVSQALKATMKAYTDACNWVSDHVFRTHDLTFQSLNAKLYHKLRSLFGLKAQMAQSVMKTVIAKYKEIRTTGTPWVRVKFKKPQYDLVYGRDWSLTVKDDGLEASVNTLGKRIRMPLVNKGAERYFDGTWKYGTAKLVHKHGKWLLHIPVTKEIPDFDPQTAMNVCGVDLGIHFLAVSFTSSTGKTMFFSGRQVKQNRAHRSKVRRELQQRGTPSARRRLKRIGQREHRMMQDKNHCIAKALVCSQPSGTIFVLEDLTGIRAATEKVALKDRYVQVSWSFYDLREKIEYKALMHGSSVMIVDPHYTSQKCPVCGHTQRSNRDRKNHSFRCRNCGYQSNDDRAAAMNLCHMGMDQLLTQL